MKLRYAGTCALCLAPVGAGAEAEWDGSRRTVTCLACADGATVAVLAGTAGASAQAKADQLRAEQAERHRRLKERQPVLGRLKIAIANEPQAGASWAKGAVGEQKFGAALDRTGDEVLVLHDRRFPRSKANIDHIAVAPGGVWVIDAKRYKGVVTKVDKGGWFRTDLRLTVGGRDRTALVRGVQRQVQHVEQALATLDGDPVAVRGALCFVDAEFRLFAKPFAIDGVLVAWGKALRERLLQPGPMDADRRTAVHRHLATSFPPAA